MVFFYLFYFFLFFCIKSNNCDICLIIVMIRPHILFWIVGLHVYVPLFQFDLWISSQVFGVLEQIQTPPHPLIFVFLYIYIYIYILFQVVFLGLSLWVRKSSLCGWPKPFFFSIRQCLTWSIFTKENK